MESQPLTSTIFKFTFPFSSNLLLMQYESEKMFCIFSLLPYSTKLFTVGMYKYDFEKKIINMNLTNMKTIFGRLLMSLILKIHIL